MRYGLRYGTGLMAGLLVLVFGAPFVPFLSAIVADGAFGAMILGRLDLNVIRETMPALLPAT